MVDKLTKKKTVRMGQISFINCLPFNYALSKLDKENLDYDFNLFTAPPAELNQKLFNKEIDIAPVSSFEYLRHQSQYNLLPGFSVSSGEKAISVLFLSKKPLSELKKINLTPQSASSVALLKVLFVKKYGLRLEDFDFEVSDSIHEDLDNKLLIGDDALRVDKSKYSVVLDLGAEWFDLTKMPMVFGLWTYNKDFDLDQNLISILEKLKEDGFDAYFPDVIIESYIKTGVPKARLEEYFRTLNYDFADEHRNSLNLFKEYLHEIGLIREL